MQTKFVQKRQQSKSPEYVNNQVVIKSQKILNSVSNFHMKTQQERVQEEHKSPEGGRTEKIEPRETWKQRPRMPYNKLPDDFYQGKQKKQNNKNYKQDMLKRLDIMVQNNQYKEVQKYLEPIKIERKQQEKKKEAGENRNPLIPYRKYMKAVTKIAQDLNQDISIQKFKLPPKLSQNIRLHECIILELLKRGHNTGTIKKMLNVPSLKIVCVRQQPMNHKQSRSLIRDWVSMWQQKLNNEDLPFINVYQVFFNYPTGAVSILTQYFKCGSLLNLLGITHTLPESVIRQIFGEVLNHLNIFYEITELHFGGLSPSQIMFTDSGKIKLAMGLFYHIPSITSNNVFYLRAPKNNLFDFNITQTKFMKNEIQRSIDVFKLGFIILQCAIGSLQNFEQTPVIYDTIKYIFTEQGQRKIEKDNVCCVFHSQNYLIHFNLNQTDRTTKREKNDSENVLNYMRLLKDRFSIQFINFLCSCLKLLHHKRATLSDLRDSPFISAPHDNDNHTAKIVLDDLLLILRGENQQKLYESGVGQKIDKFIGPMIQVLYECKKQVLTEIITKGKEKIIALGRQTGKNPEILFKKLDLAISQIIKSK